MIVSRGSVAALGLAALLGGCAVEAAPHGLGAQSLKASDPDPTPVRANGVVGQVTAESRYGHGTVSGPVRRGARNLEVQLPGGTWVDCGRNCGDALRRETIDFWENHAGPRDAGADGPGYFIWRR